MKQPSKAIIILEPMEALEILAALEAVQERSETTKALNTSINRYRKQIHNNLTNEQLDDAFASREVQKLLGKYY